MPVETPLSRSTPVRVEARPETAARSEQFAVHQRLAEREQHLQRVARSGLTAFLVAGFILVGSAAFPSAVSSRIALVALGLAVIAFARFHYAWFLRHPAAIRERLIDIESHLGISCYRIAPARATIGPFKLRYIRAVDGLVLVAVVAAFALVFAS